MSIQRLAACHSEVLAGRLHDVSLAVTGEARPPVSCPPLDSQPVPPPWWCCSVWVTQQPRRGPWLPATWASLPISQPSATEAGASHPFLRLES